MGTVIAATIAVPVAVVGPTFRSDAAPHPVTPRLSTQPLTGIDHRAVRPTQTPTYLANQRRGHLGSLRRSTRLRVLTGQLDTASFQTFAVTWEPVDGPTAPPPLVITARYRNVDGWSRWVRLGSGDGDTASGAEAHGVTRSGTTPYYTGPANGAQVRIVTAGTQPLPADLRLDLIEPGTSSADAAVTAPPPVGSAVAASVDPNIVTRAQWGANESLRDKTLTMTSTYQVAFVHHTAGTNNYTAAQGPAVVRGLYAYYVNSLGYADIGYNFLIDKYGTIYEGRYGSMDNTPRQAATGGFNTDTMAVAALGNFSNIPAPTAMVTSIGRVIGYRLAKLHRNPYGHRTLVAEDGSYKYPIGKRVMFNVISGHRDASATSCPGDNLYNRLPDIRRAAKNWMRANLVEPRMTGGVSTVNEAPLVAVHSRVLKSQSWRWQLTNSCTGNVVRTLSGTATPSNPIRLKWRGSDQVGSPVGSGRYRASLTSQNSTSRSVPWSRQVVVGESPPLQPTRRSLRGDPQGHFVALPTTRLAATATGVGLTSDQILGPNGRIEIPVLGQAGIPATNVSAVAVMVSTSCASKSTTVSGTPGAVKGAGAPIVSTRPGLASRGTAAVRVGPNGMIALTNASGYVDITAHVVGYWSTTGIGGVATIADRQLGSALSVGTGATQLQVGGVNGIASDATMAVLNVRSALGNAGSRLTIWPEGSQRPLVPNVVWDARSRGSAAVLVALGPTGAVNVAANRAATKVHVDVEAVGAPSLTSTLRFTTPNRLWSQRLSAGRSSRVAVVGRAGLPTQGVKAVVLQVSAAKAARPTSLTIWANGGTQPKVPSLVVGDRGFGSSLAVVRLGTKGSVRVLSSATRVSAAITVVGWIS